MLFPTFLGLVWFYTRKKLAWLSKKRKIKRLVKEPSRQTAVITVGPWQDILREGWWERQFSLWLPQGWDLTPKGRKKMWKPSSALHCKYFSALPLGRSSQSISASSGRDFGSLMALPKSRCCPEGKELWAAPLSKWREQEKEHWHRRLHKETLLLRQKSLRMRAALSGLLWDVSEPPESSLASLLELGCDPWAQPFCTFFPKGLINSSRICRNPEDFLQQHNLMEHKSSDKHLELLTAVSLSHLLCEARNKREIFCAVCVTSLQYTFKPLRLKIQVSFICSYSENCRYWCSPLASTLMDTGLLCMGNHVYFCEIDFVVLLLSPSDTKSGYFPELLCHHFSMMLPRLVLKTQPQVLLQISDFYHVPGQPNGRFPCKETLLRGYLSQL